MKISKIEIIHVRPRWSFLKMLTDEGLVGWGEAIVEGRSRTVEMAVKELEPQLIGSDPRRIEHLWQAMYRGAFYRGGPILSSAISGIEQAMWDILGKSLGCPVYQLLGGAVRDRIRLYKAVQGDGEELVTLAKAAVDAGFTFVKTGVNGPLRFLEPPAVVRREVERMECLRSTIGQNCDFALDFHGRVSPSLAIQLCKALEPTQPAFVEEPCLPESVDSMVLVARSTSIPIATGERLFTKWAFREILQKQAAAILQPDLAHCGGILEGKKIAAMAEANFCAVAPHNPLGPINLAASLQLAACVPNFLCQEHRSLGEGYFKQPFVVRDGYVDIPTGPGLGIEVDEDAIENLRYDGSWATPLWTHADDNSVADW